MEMRLLLFLLIKLALFETIGGELRIRPSGPNFIKTSGSSTVFTCEYISNGDDDGSEPFVWLDNKGEVVGAQNRRYIEDDLGIKKLYLISISEDDAGEYKCVKGAESKSIYLQIFKDITFDDAPLVQQLNISSDGTIRCVVSGNPEPSVSWRKNLRRIGMTDQSRFIVTREGLKVLNVTRDDEGLYTCRAEVEVSGRYSEQRIQVFVNYPPTILGNLEQVDALLGSQTVISCPVLGFPTPRVNFTKEEEISSVADAIVANNTLTFVNISESHEGQYRCIATNILGHDSRTFSLNVLVPPKVIVPPLVTTVVGSEVTMSCLGAGDPVPYMTMSRKMDGRNLFEGEESSSGRMQASRSLGVLNVTIAKATVEDSDVFTCTAVSAVGRSSQDVRLVVQYSPHFEVGSMTSLVYGWGNQVVQMNCKVHGEPKVNIQWFKGHDLVMIENYQEFETPSGSVLQVSLRRESGEGLYGTYTCRATNDLGSDDFNFILQKPPVPDKPEVVLERLRPDDVSIRINSHRILGEATFQVTHYLVSLVREDGAVLNTSVPIGEVDQTSNSSTATSVIENLVPNTSYNLFVSSVNTVGPGEATRVEFKTPESSYDQRLPMF